MVTGNDITLPTPPAPRRPNTNPNQGAKMKKNSPHIVTRLLLTQDLPPDESLIMANTELNYRAAKEQVKRIAAKLDALYNEKRTAETAEVLRNYHVFLDEIRGPTKHWTEAAMIEKVAKTKLPTLDEVNTNGK